MMKNLFIAFEGIDGCGKSTQVKLLAEHLEKSGHKVIVTCEPTNNPIGLMIRNIFNHRMEADHRVIAGLFVADRLDHLLNKNDGILKRLEEGYTVISDRFYFSSYAYQGTHMPLDWVIQANSLSTALLRPHLNIFLDITPEVGMNRLAARKSAIELYETIDNLTKVKAKYMEAFEKLKGVEQLFITDGNRAPGEIAQDIQQEVARLMGQ